MALNNPSNLYSGGSAVVNATPYTQFYLQSVAKKRAKDEALDNYFRDFQKSINPAGMRTQDIEGFSGKVNDWRGFYNQNKEAITNPKLDNGKAYSEFMSRHQDLLADTQRSKNAGDISKQYVLPIVANPDKRTRVTDLAMKSIGAHDLSIYDKSHQQLQPQVLDFDAKKFDLNKQSKLQNFLKGGLKMDEAIERIEIDPKTHSKKVFFDLKLNPEALKIVGARAASVYDSDDEYQGFIDEEIERNGIDENLNDLYKKYTGKDITSNQDFAAAYEMNKIQKERKLQKNQGYNQWQGYSAWGKPNETTPTFGEGAKELAKRAKNAIANGTPEEADRQLKEYVGTLFSGNGKYVLDPNIGGIGADGKFYIYYHNRWKDGTPDMEETLVRGFDLDDDNAVQKIDGFYQEIMGADAKTEGQNVKSAIKKVGTTVPPSTPAKKRKKIIY